MHGIALHFIEEARVCPTHSNDEKPTISFSSDRDFSIWRYRYGHSQLILRSLPSADLRRLDIFFEGVRWLSLPTRLGSIRITSATDEASVLPVKMRHSADTWGFFQLAISASEASGLIICGTVKAAFSHDDGNGNPDYEEVDVVWNIRKR